jgi:hypothetical protein
VTGDLRHPTTIEIPKPTLAEAFVKVTVDRCVAPIWHFKTAVRKDWALGPQGADAPTAEAPIQTLALFKKHDPEVDLEVLGHLLQHEVDPADWLDESLTQLGMTVVSRKPVKMLAGVIGDAVTTWTSEGDPYAGRFFATKWGPRLYVLGLRTKAGNYDRFADDLFVSIATFEVIDDSLGLFAEKVLTLEDKTPVPYKTHLPESWLIMPEKGGAKGSSLQAKQVHASGDEAVFGGQLSFAVIDRAAANKPRDVAQAYLEAVRDNRFVIEKDAFEEETPRKLFDKSWYLTSPAAMFDGTPAEVRCRVMLDERVWVVAGVLGPTRSDDVLAWMRNKRALDIVTSTLELEPNSDPPSRSLDPGRAS